MRLAEMNWMQVEAHVKRDDRCVLPIGSVEQHAYLSLCVDMILAERVALEAAEPLGVPVYPVLPFGLTPSFVDYPGTVSIKLKHYAPVIEDILNGIARAGFKRIVIVNGHGGNGPVGTVLAEWLDGHRDCQVKFHEWWKAPKTWAKVQEIDPEASHASWMENFPSTRLSGVEMPTTSKEQLDSARFAKSDPGMKREILGDGNYHGVYQRPDADTDALWAVAVEETRAIITDNWD